MSCVPVDAEATNIEINVNGENVVPAGQNTTYTCTTQVGDPAWLWNFGGVADQETVAFPTSDSYDQRGIFVPEIDDGQISTLTITGILGNNNTRIHCSQYLGGLQFGNTTEMLTFQTYGK